MSEKKRNSLSTPVVGSAIKAAGDNTHVNTDGSQIVGSDTAAKKVGSDIKGKPIDPETMVSLRADSDLTLIVSQDKPKRPVRLVSNINFGDTAIHSSAILGADAKLSSDLAAIAKEAAEAVRLRQEAAAAKEAELAESQRQQQELELARQAELAKAAEQEHLDQAEREAREREIMLEQDRKAKQLELDRRILRNSSAEVMASPRLTPRTSENVDAIVNAVLKRLQATSLALPNTVVRRDGIASASFGPVVADEVHLVKPLSPESGGTGQTNLDMVYDAISGMTQKGQMIAATLNGTRSIIAPNIQPQRRVLVQYGNGQEAVEPGWERLTDYDMPDCIDTRHLGDGRVNDVTLSTLADATDAANANALVRRNKAGGAGFTHVSMDSASLSSQSSPYATTLREDGSEIRLDDKPVAAVQANTRGMRLWSAGEISFVTGSSDKPAITISNKGELVIRGALDFDDGQLLDTYKCWCSPGHTLATEGCRIRLQVLQIGRLVVLDWIIPPRIDAGQTCAQIEAKELIPKDLCPMGVVEDMAMMLSADEECLGVVRVTPAGTVTVRLLGGKPIVGPGGMSTKKSMQWVL